MVHAPAATTFAHESALLHSAGARQQTNNKVVMLQLLMAGLGNLSASASLMDQNTIKKQSTSSTGCGCITEPCYDPPTENPATWACDCYDEWKSKCPQCSSSTTGMPDTACVKCLQCIWCQSGEDHLCSQWKSDYCIGGITKCSDITSLMQLSN